MRGQGDATWRHANLLGLKMQRAREDEAQRAGIVGPPEMVPGGPKFISEVRVRLVGITRAWTLVSVGFP